MNNRIKINTDGINIYVTLFVKSNKKGKIAMSIIVLILLFILGAMINETNDNNLKNFVFPITIFAILIIVFPVRYLIWNLCGKEHLIINTKSISYKFDYGIYQTNLKTILHKKLASGFELLRKDGEIKKGNLVFYDFRKKDNLPIQIYQTSVLLDKEKVNMIDAEIRQIYEDEFNEKYHLIGFSPN